MGPPDSIECNAHGQVWSYRGSDGELVPFALTLRGEHVLAGAPAAPALVTNDMPASRPYLGQPSQELVRAIGNPVSQSHGALATTFTFANGVEVALHDGIVVRIAK